MVDKRIVSDYVKTKNVAFTPLLEDELFFAQHSSEIYTAYLKMRLEKLREQEESEETSELIFELNYINENRQKILQRSNILAE